MLDDAFFPPPFRAPLVEAWADACHGRPDAAFAKAQGVWREAQGAGHAPGAASALGQMAWTCLQLGEVERGLVAAQDALALWTGAAFHSGIVWAGAMHAWLLLEGGMPELAGEKAVAAHAASSTADARTRCFATNVLGVVLWYSRHLDRAESLCAQAVAAARLLSEPVVLGWWLINLAGVGIDIAARCETRGEARAAAARRAAALAVNAEAIAIAAREGDDWGLQLGLCNGAEYLMAMGRETDALASLARCKALARPLGSRSMSHFFYTKTQVLIHFKRFEEALETGEAALQLAERGGQTDAAAYALRYLSQVHESCGRFEIALALFKRFHETNVRLAGEAVQRRARIAEIAFETGRIRELVDETRRQLTDATEASRLDPLTGLLNRRGFDALMATRYSNGAPHAFAILDLDHFKRINDAHSHLVGDEVLRRTAAILAPLCAGAHHAVRLGGEEFVIVIDADRLGPARALCEAVRQAIAGADWPALRPGLAVTVSIGVAMAEPALSVADTLARADARLYAAKAAGRNRVVWLDEARPADMMAG